MRNQLRVGTTAENDSWVYPSGILTYDSEKKAARLHDGETPGGFEMVGERAYTPPVGPGPEELTVGDMEKGFFGEVTGDELITYGGLASDIGLSAGSTLFNNESLWLKFAYQNNVLFVAKKPARVDVSWDDIGQQNAVYSDGNWSGATVDIGELSYQVTLMSGGDDDPANEAGGEWNALMYPVHVDDPNDEGWGIDYSDDDLGFNSDGRRTWCQEVWAGDTSRRISRGSNGVDPISDNSPDYTGDFSGWRPCLRLQV